MWKVIFVAIIFYLCEGKPHSARKRKYEEYQHRVVGNTVITVFKLKSSNFRLHFLQRCITKPIRVPLNGYLKGSNFKEASK